MTHVDVVAQCVILWSTLGSDEAFRSLSDVVQVQVLAI